MIKKLRLKFIILATIAVIILLTAIVFSMNIINYNSVIRDADEVIEVLSKNSESLPLDKRDDKPKETFENKNETVESGLQRLDSDGSDFEDNSQNDFEEDIFNDEFFEKMPHDMSPEIPYESRFFSVIFNDDGEIESCDISRIKAIGDSEAREYGKTAFADGQEKGFADNYRFSKILENGKIRIIFLDIGRKLEAYKSFLNASVAMAGAGLILFFIVIFLFSKRIVRPAAEAYEKQKRFISDAGHEIKTPLTIIRADADILEMDYGKNEWVEDIQRQTERLSRLTNDLIYLSKTEEGAGSMKFIDFPISDVVDETAASFDTLAKSQEKSINKHIEKGLSYTGDEKSISQLISILTDNAIKYSPENSNIDISLQKRGKGVELSVYNKTENEMEKDKLKLLFDRFYRTDESRNSKTGGYGIGLSMAKAIVEAHGGKITAKTDDGYSLKIVVEL